MTTNEERAWWRQQLRRPDASLVAADQLRLIAHIDALEAKIADYTDACATIIDSSCGTDEKHCTCVPLLRARIAELEAKR